MMHSIRLSAAIALVVLMPVTTWAWTDKTDLAIVTSATHIISRDNAIPLVKLEKDIQQGAMVSDETFAKLIPIVEKDPVAAIESEMYLLQSVRGDRVDPYYGYRLGVLGKLVANATSPMANASPTYRNKYYADAERSIASMSLKMADRRFVDPRAYFNRVISEAQTQDDVLLKEYQTGAGFEGMAKAGLSDNTSRSINAVADVWHTILTNSVVAANISESQIRSYALNAIEFYLARNNILDADAAYKRLVAKNLQTPDLQSNVADMYFESGHYDRAIEEYKAVLSAQPHRRDVIEKIAAYYVKIGEDSFEKGELENARDSFQLAVDADKLHPTAQKRLLEMEALIEERTSRMDAVRTIIDEAVQLEQTADQQAIQRNFAQAIAALKDAETRYTSVTDEFPEEYRRAANGLNGVRLRIRELKNQLVANAQDLSNSGSAAEARHLASKASVAEDALRSLLSNELTAELSKLRQDLATQFRTQQ